MSTLNDNRFSTSRLIPTSVNQPIKVQPVQKKINPALIIIPILLILGGIAFLIWWLYNKNKKHDENLPCGGNKLCKQGEICDSNGKCVKATTQPCSATNLVGTCPSNQLCDPNGRGCINKQSLGCSTNADCTGGQVCRRNICSNSTPEPVPDICGPEHQTGWMNWDRVEIKGDLIKQVGVNKQNIAENCAQECEKTPGCTFGVYENQGSGDTTGWCWLSKSGHGDAPLGNNRSSIVRVLPASCTPINDFVRRRGTTVDGTLLNALSGSNLQACEQLCINTSGCQAAVSSDDGLCHLYTNVKSIEGSAVDNLSFKV